MPITVHVYVYVCMYVMNVCMHASFVCKHMSFVCKHMSFVCKHMSFVCKHMSFVCKHMSFVCKHMIYVQNLYECPYIHIYIRKFCTYIICLHTKLASFVRMNAHTYTYTYAHAHPYEIQRYYAELFRGNIQNHTYMQSYFAGIHRTTHTCRAISREYTHPHIHAYISIYFVYLHTTYMHVCLHILYIYIRKHTVLNSAVLCRAISGI
jgi:hypothetical protein